MPLRPPLVPHETFVADPPELPVRRRGEEGLSPVAQAELTSRQGDGVALSARTADGQDLVVQVQAVRDGVIRVRLSEDPAAVTRSAQAITLVHCEPYAEAVVTATEKTITVKAGPLTAQITLAPWGIRFLDANDRPLVTGNGGERDVSGRLRTLPFGRSHVNGRVVAYHESFTAQADEHFVGFGEKFTTLDARGQRRVMWNYDAFGCESDRSYKNIPLYLSSRGYGVLVHSGTPVEFDVCQSTHACVQIIVPDDLIDYYVLAGPNPSEILNRYDQLTCRPTMPPKWAFGTWISSSFTRDSQDKALERAHSLRERGIPADVLHLDCYWQVAGHWSDMRWDSDNFPDPVGMLESLNKLGFRVCLWINPHISHHSPLFSEAAERGFFLRDQSGEVYLADIWNGGFPAGGIVDFTNPEATVWFTGLLTPLLRQGVTVFETDLAEVVPADAVASNGMSGLDLHNVYSLLFNDAVAAATMKVAGHDLVWTRSSFLGGQRHSAQWSGDASCTYPAMASTLRGGLSHGLSGVPFWSHDVGGFAGTPSADLYVRWAQFGALSPLVRFHGATTRLPWEYPIDTERAIIDILQLRYQLMPYLYSAATEAAALGTPMMRALLVDSPDDPAAWGADLEYRLGRDLLVAPMINPDGTRMVYLPAGEWADHWTGVVHGGGRYIRVTPPLDRLPLFVRHGALIPTIPLAESIADGPFSNITLVSWGGRTSRTVIHDVDGVTTVMATRVGDRLDLRSKGPAPIRSVSFAFVHGGQPPRVVHLNGKEIAID